MSDQQDQEYFLYIIGYKKAEEITSPVKIGIGSDPLKRLNSLQTGNPSPIEIYHVFSIPRKDIARDLERAFHTVMAEKRLLGEWFDMSPSAALFFMHINLGTSLNASTDFSIDEINEAIRASCGGYDRCPMCKRKTPTNQAPLAIQ